VRIRISTEKYLRQLCASAVNARSLLVLHAMHRLQACSLDLILCAQIENERYPRKFCIWHTSAEMRSANFSGSEIMRSDDCATLEDDGDGAHDAAQDERRKKSAASVPR
jgi:hypothetical protein